MFCLSDYVGRDFKLKHYQIPTSKILEGIQKCLSNTKRYVEDSRLIFGSGSLEHAVVLAIFAAEELAKAGIISQRFQQQRGRKSIQVERIIFQGRDAHDYKIKEAKRILGSLMLESSKLGVARFPFPLGRPDVEASPETRLQCAFVDWDNKDWKFGTSFHPANLTDLLEGIEKHILKIAKKHGLKPP